MRPTTTRKSNQESHQEHLTVLRAANMYEQRWILFILTKDGNPRTKRPADFNCGLKLSHVVYKR